MSNDIKKINISKDSPDKLWGQQEISNVAEMIINTPEFQRMDKIKQLGFSNIIFRTAKHTRFQHMIGVYCVIKRLLRQILKNHQRFGLEPPFNSDEDFDLISEIVALAGLLHDIPHIPYGHTLEDEFRGLYLKHDDLKNTRLWYLLYDERSNIAKIFDADENYFNDISNNDLRDLIFLILKYDYKIDENETYVKFEDLINIAENETTDNEQKKMLNLIIIIYKKMKKNKIFEPYMSDLISNTICADIIDYLKRDGAYTTGSKDYTEVENYFIIQNDSITREKHLVIKLFTEEEPKTRIINKVIGMMDERFSMAESVYYTATKMEADVMFGKLLSLVEAPPDVNPYDAQRKQDCNDWETDLSYYWEDMGNSILAMNDETIFDYCYKMKKQLLEKNEIKRVKRVNQLINMLISRKIFQPCITIHHHTAKHKTLTLNLLNETKTLTLFNVLYQTFREPEELPKLLEETEDEINDIFNDEKIHVLIFCPPHKPRAKEMETFVEISKGEIKPLHVLVKKSEYPHLLKQQREAIKTLGTQYEELWRFFVILHPDDIKNNLIKYAVTLKFWNVLAKKLENKIEIGDDIITGIAFPPIDLPSKLITEWLNCNSIYCHEDYDRIIHERIDSFSAKMKRIKDWDSLINKIMENKDKISTVDDICKIIFDDELSIEYEKNVLNWKIKVKKYRKPGEYFNSIKSVRDSDKSSLPLAGFRKDNLKSGEGKSEDKHGVGPYSKELRIVGLLEEKNGSK